MKDALTPIAGIAGVMGAALFSSDDRCLTSALTPPYEDLLIERVMRTLRLALVTLQVNLDPDATWRGLFLRCDGGHLVVRRIGDMVMVVFGQPTMNIAMVNVGLNVAALKLQAGEGSGLAPTPRPSAPMGSGPIPSVTPNATPHAVPIPTVSFPQAATTTGGVIPRATLEAVLRALAKYIGPSAQVIMLEQLVALGLAPNNVPFVAYSDMLDRLAAHVPDPARRVAFVIEAELAGIHTITR